MIDEIIILFIVISIIFSVLGVIGLFRFPDFYTRIHAAGLVGSFGLLFAGLGVLLYAYTLYAAGDEAWFNYGAHVLLALIIVVVTASTSTHAIARSAYRSGNTPKIQMDALKKDEHKMTAQQEARK
ncbi:Na(+)/H(+) antiporter subunit G1 [Methanocorpusculaceae archaeon Sp1]|uniref:Na(+)/H(+) antiporter subunit G1 n=1 Tax=Methanorbis furvi TaxID=3028299 RepID=A0AAE4SA01_9EURY|nr:Na(+)/H(+) antiporter subunit G1 [Methanocorpusculaceae archaeon Sp1]MDV0441756.1 Na(+)/H(+) antiporter subunit G1 [Methanocorpusculaceae archaeon Ag1]